MNNTGGNCFLDFYSNPLNSFGSLVSLVLH